MIFFSYSENNYDIERKSRRIELYYNFTKCDTECTYIGINYTTNYVHCECSAANREEIIIAFSFDTFIELVFRSNFILFKCISTFKFIKDSGLLFIPLVLMEFLHAFTTIQTLRQDAQMRKLLERIRVEKENMNNLLKNFNIVSPLEISSERQMINSNETNDENRIQIFQYDSLSYEEALEKDNRSYFKSVFQHFMYNNLFFSILYDNPNYQVFTRGYKNFV